MSETTTKRTMDYYAIAPDSRYLRFKENANEKKRFVSKTELELKKEVYLWLNMERCNIWNEVVVTVGVYTTDAMKVYIITGMTEHLLWP